MKLPGAPHWVPQGHSLILSLPRAQRVNLQSLVCQNKPGRAKKQNWVQGFHSPNGDDFLGSSGMELALGVLNKVKEHASILLSSFPRLQNFLGR